jgi:UDP-N-acetylmuramoyl-L-alanyl-D-glutamate--2,6-diaminopimelate ligase
MNLRDLSVGLGKPVISGDLNTNITSVAYDSRKVQQGTIFVALRGTKVDGHDFISTAIQAGASAIVAAEAPPEDCTVAWVHVTDTRKALAIIAAEFYRKPAHHLSMGGITGTNGKTTIAFLVHHLMNKALLRCGLMGTVFYDMGDGQQVPATHTTPESLEIHEHLGRMCDNGCRAAIMEVSSHALDQERVYGIPFRASVFTNLTQDHLDYHETMEKYFEAKTKLFEMAVAQPKGQLIINTDDLWGKKLAIKFQSSERVVSYGFGATTDLRAANVRYDLTGTTFELLTAGREFLVRTPLIGDFNVYNTLAALGAARAMGANLREAITHLKTTPQVPGRLERITDETNRFQVFVDYAHTPDALANALRTIRMLRPRRIITVFGCGGDRDRTKRPLMAQAVQSGSDVCIVTSDNPRFEDPKQIIADAVRGFGRKNYVEIEDRMEAIRSAILNAQPGDIVLVAGKGHETYQEIKGVKHPFDDRRIVHGALMTRRKNMSEKVQMRIEAEQMREQQFQRPSQAEDDEDFGGPRRKWNE